MKPLHHAPGPAPSPSRALNEILMKLKMIFDFEVKLVLVEILTNTA